MAARVVMYLLLLLSLESAEGHAGTYIGCYEDMSVDRAMKGQIFDWMDENCVSKCVPECGGAGFAYAGLRGKRCFCDDVYDRYGAAQASECRWPCPADSSQICGGYNLIKSRLSVWRTNALNGGWSSWVSGECSVTCGTGSSSQTRECDNPMPENNGMKCVGAHWQSRSCVANRNCPVDGGWSEWSGRMECPATCGGAQRQRTRLCDNPAPADGGADCVGAASDAEICGEDPCPVDGGWSVWREWSACSETCGGGARSRSRSCDDPIPQHGGAECPDSASESDSCEAVPCPVDGGWSEWTSPSPENGGAPCSGEETQSRTCNTDPCPQTREWRYRALRTEECQHQEQVHEPVEASLTSCFYVCVKLEECEYVGVRENHRNTCYFLRGGGAGGFSENIDKCYLKGPK